MFGGKENKGEELVPSLCECECVKEGDNGGEDNSGGEDGDITGDAG